VPPRRLEAAILLPLLLRCTAPVAVRGAFRGRTPRSQLRRPCAPSSARDTTSFGCFGWGCQQALQHDATGARTVRRSNQLTVAVPAAESPASAAAGHSTDHRQPLPVREPSPYRWPMIAALRHLCTPPSFGVVLPAVRDYARKFSNSPAPIRRRAPLALPGAEFAARALPESPSPDS
jgi:hypothetical protein